MKQNHQWKKLLILLLSITLSVALFPQNKAFAATGDGSIDSTIKINHDTTNGPSLSEDDYYSVSIDSMGDLDGDGVGDIVVGAYADDNGGTDRGAVHLHFMNTDGSIDSTVEINDSTANGAVLSDEDYYGTSVASIGDLNGDGVRDLVVGAHGDDNGGTDRGAVHIHFMNTDGSIDSTVEINNSTANGPTLADEDYYGFAVASIGDLNGDGVGDIAVGAPEDDGDGILRGAIHIHFMNTDGSIDSTIEINDTTTNGPTLSNFDYYGLSIASVGDLNADGVLDLVVGSPSSTSIGKGKVYIHFMNADGSIDSTVEINSSTENGPSLSNYDLYGFSLTSIGDLNSDGVDDLAVGSPGDDAGGTDRGEIYIHFMNTDGSIDSTIELNGSTANGATLVDGTTYGASIASIGDLDGNGINDLAAGIDVDGSFHGALLIHFMHKVTVAVAENKFSEDKRCHYDTPPEITWVKITPDEEGGISGILITWTQYSANKVTIKIDDGTDNFPWELSKTANDGHEFLPNVATWQEIKVKPYNHCRSGEYSVPTSYNLYPYGWYNE